MSDRVHVLLAALTEPPHDRQRLEIARRSDWLNSADDDEVVRLVAALTAAPPADEDALARLLSQLIQRQASRPPSALVPAPEALTALYARLGPASRARPLVLRWLTARREATALAAATECLVNDPPRDLAGVAQAFGPLFEPHRFPCDAVFPRLLDAFVHSQAATFVIDLANHVTRTHLVSLHPATARSAALTRVLGELAHRLARIEEHVGEGGATAAAIAQTVSEAVSLSVSLCDALALIGDRAAIGKLYQTLELRHRRLRTEAAAALARLGEEPGRDSLVRLAAEPMARLRVLAYADELGLLDRVDEQYRTAQARAEAELILWLAQPTQFGAAPHECELVDQRTQYWPGYDEPIDCFLFRFTYHFPETTFSNIGIGGPLAHAFAADLADSSPDDIYATFAGWHAQHDEIRECDERDFSAGDRRDAARIARRVEDEGYEQIEPRRLASFFGDHVLVAQAQRDGQSGLIVADDADVFWYPQGKGPRPLGPHEVLCTYKGRKLLRTFNA